MGSKMKHKHIKSEAIINETTGGFGETHTKKLCLRCKKPFNSKRKKGLLYVSSTLQKQGAFCKKCTNVIINKFGDEVHKQPELTLLN